MYGYKQFILETKQQQLCNEKQIVRHTQKGTEPERTLHRDWTKQHRADYSVSCI